MKDFSKPLPKPNDNPYGSYGNDFKALVPELKDIPEDFEDRRNWIQWQRDWFFKGLEKLPTPKTGIVLDDAMRHLAAIQRSWEPKHGHKELYVAYLASLWFEKP